MDRQVLVINYYTSVEFGRREKELGPVPWLAEVFEVFAVMTHDLLLRLIPWRQNSLVSLSEVALVGVNLLQDEIDVAFQAVAIGIEGAKWLQKLEHFLDSLSHHASHLCAMQIV